MWIDGLRRGVGEILKCTWSPGADFRCLLCFIYIADAQSSYSTCLSPACWNKRRVIMAVVLLYGFWESKLQCSVLLHQSYIHQAIFSASSTFLVSYIKTFKSILRRELQDDFVREIKRAGQLKIWTGAKRIDREEKVMFSKVEVKEAGRLNTVTAIVPTQFLLTARVTGPGHHAWL